MLRQGLQQLGINPEQTVEKLEQYIRELELFNAAYDLVGADTHDDIVVRHILDSLAAFPVLKRIAEEIANRKNGETVLFADVGTGGGLPGIPLAVCFPQYQFILIERMTKRCSFLENCKAVLGLKNVQILNKEAERVTPGIVDIAVFRAFRPLDRKMTKILLRIPNDQGILAAYKAREAKIAEEMAGIAQYVTEWSKERLSVPFLPDNERNLVLIPASNRIKEVKIKPAANQQRAGS